MAHVRKNLSTEKLPEAKHLGNGDKVRCTCKLCKVFTI